MFQEAGKEEKRGFLTGNLNFFSLSFCISGHSFRVNKSAICNTQLVCLSQSSKVIKKKAIFIRNKKAAEKYHRLFYAIE